MVSDNDAPGSISPDAAPTAYSSTARAPSAGFPGIPLNLDPRPRRRQDAQSIRRADLVNPNKCVGSLTTTMRCRLLVRAITARRRTDWFVLVLSVSAIMSESGTPSPTR